MAAAESQPETRSQVAQGQRQGSLEHLWCEHMYSSILKNTRRGSITSKLNILGHYFHKEGRNCFGIMSKKTAVSHRLEGKKKKSFSWLKEKGFCGPLEHQQTKTCTSQEMSQKMLKKSHPTEQHQHLVQMQYLTRSSRIALDGRQMVASAKSQTGQKLPLIQSYIDNVTTLLQAACTARLLERLEKLLAWTCMRFKATKSHSSQSRKGSGIIASALPWTGKGFPW